MIWRDLPSLAALRAFEAAVRTGSLSAAARELNVTHAAIAQHVRSLENHFGQSLLLRAGQGMAPTASGASLASALGEGFETIVQACLRLSDETQARPLVLACTPSFAENWLMPRIGGFWAAHPDVQISILPGNAVVDLRRDQVDLAVRYGRGTWPGLNATKLLTGDFIIAASPQVCATLNSAKIDDFAQCQWLMDSTRAEQHILAKDFGMNVDTNNLKTFETNGMVLAAARAGLGVALQSKALISRDLDQGTLQELFALDSTELGYWIVTSPTASHPHIRTLTRWLKSQVTS